MHSKIEQVRQQKLANFCQVILIDSEGIVVESCDSIFDTSDLVDTPVQEWFPFIESVFPSLGSIELEVPELLFSKVENPAEYLPGYYDFSFSKIKIEDKVHFLWEIFDYSTLYRDYRVYQQRRNDLEIQRQIFSLENKKLKSKKDISDRNLDAVNKSNQTAFDKNRLNTFDAMDMTFNAMQSFQKDKEKDYSLDSLDSISSILKKIVDELPEKEIDLTIVESGLEREFSLENLLYDSIPYISTENINVMEACVAEELPTTLFGNPLDFKRTIVGLALNTSKFFKDCILRLELYLQDRTIDKCIVGIRITCVEGEEIEPDMMDVLLRLAIIKRMVELHQGKLEIDSTTTRFGAKMICHIPFLLS